MKIQDFFKKFPDEESCKAHLNSLVTMGDFPPTDQDIVVKNELTAEINTQLNEFNSLVSKEIKEFNQAFNKKNLNYLLVE